VLTVKKLPRIKVSRRMATIPKGIRTSGSISASASAMVSDEGL
jgi:hypothetical protein